MKAYDLVAAENVALPPWMILEYIPLNLSQVLQNLDQDDRAKAMTHISSALDYLHSRGITHRDVKPDNVLVVYDPGRKEHTVFKLADFGTSKHNASELMETFTGTSKYMAPELFKTPLGYTNKVDMWSLGLTGMRLFSSWNPRSDREWNTIDFGHWIRTLILPLLEKDVPEPLRPLLKGLLLKTPHNRWCASDCTLFLWELSCAEDVSSVDESAVRSRKRPASALGDDSSEGEGGQSSTVDASRHLRSGGPSLSSGRAKQAASPELGSVAPTPHPDDGLSSDGDGEGQGGRLSGSAVTFEDDWMEGEGESEDEQ